MRIHCAYRLYEVHVYVHETRVLTYTYSVRSLFCGEQPSARRRTERMKEPIILNNAQRLTTVEVYRLLFF